MRLLAARICACGTSPQNRTLYTAAAQKRLPVILERPTAVIKLKTCISFTLTGSLVQRFQRKTSSRKPRAANTIYRNLGDFIFVFISFSCSVCGTINITETRCIFQSTHPPENYNIPVQGWFESEWSALFYCIITYMQCIFIRAHTFGSFI